MATTTTTGAGTGKVLRLLNSLEEIVLCLLLLAMIGLSCLQITLRSFFSGGLLWADPLIQQLVLWSGLLGASMATARGKHIALDLVVYLVPARFHPWVLALTHLFSTLTVAALVYAACLFLASEVTYGSPGLFSLPSWTWNLIFPLAFALITIRSGIAFVRESRNVVGRQPEEQR
jgi:TRAP-type C4-dicarboxylate transport system permease small subunit